MRGSAEHAGRVLASSSVDWLERFELVSADFCPDPGQLRANPLPPKGIQCLPDAADAAGTDNRGEAIERRSAQSRRRRPPAPVAHLEDAPLPPRRKL